MAAKPRTRRARIGGTHLTVHAVRGGLHVSAADELRANLSVSQADLEQYLDIPRQTFARRRQTGRLNTAESDRVVRFGKLFEQATALLGDGAAAAQWLKTPLSTFEGETPLARATTEFGAEQVKDIILQLEHGIAV